jgi:hypothetical protein
MGRRVDPGRFYARTGRGLTEATPGPDDQTDAWICRRLADFPPGRVPVGAATSACERCGAVVVYDPRTVAIIPPSTPQVCMQCAGIQPLPL